MAFHPPPGKAANGGSADDENTWILALVTKCIHADKNRYLGLRLHVSIYTLPMFRYEVQDAEPQEDGSPGL